MAPLKKNLFNKYLNSSSTIVLEVSTTLRSVVNYLCKDRQYLKILNATYNGFHLHPFSQSLLN